ncbi:MAG: hypothetical protein WBA52_17110 [Dolichospermum sp.]
MSIIVDTSVWSLALRRKTPSDSSPAVTILQNLITNDQVALLGAIRQEILSGIRNFEQFTRLRDYLRAFPDLELMPYVTGQQLAMSFMTVAELFQWAILRQWSVI